MKRLHAIKKQISIFFTLTILSLLYTSCYSDRNDGTDLSDNLSENALVSQRSGEEIFRAIYFLQGDLVDELPTLRNLKVESEMMKENAYFVVQTDYNVSRDSIESIEHTRGKEVFNDIINSVKKINPGVFNELSAAIATKDPHVVYEKLQQCAALVKLAQYDAIEYYDQGISFFEKAKQDGGIDVTKYDLKKTEDLRDLNSKIDGFYSSNPDLLQTNFILIVMAVIVVFLVAIFLAVYLIFGVFIVFYFVLIYLEVEVFSPGGPPQPSQPVLHLSNELIKG